MGFSGEAKISALNVDSIKIVEDIVIHFVFDPSQTRCTLLASLMWEKQFTMSHENCSVSNVSNLFLNDGK